MLKTIEEGCEGGGIFFFYFMQKIFDEVSFYFIKDFFAPQRAVFYFFMTFLSDAGGHLDLGINLEWPYRPQLPSNQVIMSICTFNLNLWLKVI